MCRKLLTAAADLTGNHNQSVEKLREQGVGNAGVDFDHRICVNAALWDG